uniref:Protein kinase domain-containing protein n=1 Tax=Ananas comosus var. bracteatus TaxID=296719 RepID=A0A6V7P464_ANACO|nr:unnamed protein product [Ananas comosus var. bracteatus]
MLSSSEWRGRSTDPGGGLRALRDRRAGGERVRYRARCVPLNEIVAIKILDFERDSSDLRNITREAQTMILIDHPNVLKAHCSFVNDHNLWVVMPYMAGGSCLHIMKSAYPNGLEEVVIATVLREVLKGLEYLHHQGHIHRDVKAGNILVDVRGGIKLGDFGVSACLFDSGDRQRTRNTFVGTPCWMAPEVMEQLHGYDFKADIWSFGITALELAHGHAPFSKYPPMKVLLMTLQNAPPGLDYERDRKFSRFFRQMIGMCLVKDPSKRPSAKKLLKHPFFKQARSQEFLNRKILEGLPTLGDRYQALKEKEEDLLAQKKMPDGEKEEISQNEYKRGISSWNFDIEDLKAQASLLPDNEDNIPNKDSEGCASSLFEIDASHERNQESSPFAASCSLKYEMDSENEDVMARNKFTPISSPDQTSSQSTKSDASDSEFKTNGTAGQHDIISNGNCRENCVAESYESVSDEKNAVSVPANSFHERRFSTSSFSSDISSLSKLPSLKHQHSMRGIEKGNGAPSNVVDEESTEGILKISKPAASNADDSDDKSKPPVVQQKGRFKVTSENIDLDKALPSIGIPKSHSMQVISQLPTISIPSTADYTSSLLGYSIFPQLQGILQANMLQRDNILSLMKQLSISEQSPVSASSSTRSPEGVLPSVPAIITEKSAIITEKSLLEAAQEREKELIQEVTDLQWRLICAQDELQRLRARNQF